METGEHDFSYFSSIITGSPAAGSRHVFEPDVRGLRGRYKIGSELDKILDQNKNTIQTSRARRSGVPRCTAWVSAAISPMTTYDPRRAPAGCEPLVGRLPPASTTRTSIAWSTALGLSAPGQAGAPGCSIISVRRACPAAGETDRGAIETQQGLNCSDPELRSSTEIATVLSAIQRREHLRTATVWAARAPKVIPKAGTPAPTRYFTAPRSGGT